MKFRKGHRVKIKIDSVYHDGGANNPKDIGGIVTSCIPGNGYCLGVRWDNGGRNVYRQEDLETVPLPNQLIKEKKNVNTV